ncbi:EAL domain-containing protein [Acetobacterium wieringae]|uniref:EAL domain-containing protein n=1 Tax=Acetobacterium wieringae TaxID=52694 RepID=UPI0026F0166F|nr:EAL domain-containing protein [Acetobacterium wieringae]
MALENFLNRIKLKEVAALSEKDDWLIENRRHAQEMMKTGTWTYVIDLDMFFFSDEYYHILETIPDCNEKKADAYYQFVHPDDRGQVSAARVEALKGSEQELEYRMITAKGNLKYVREKTRTLLDDTDQPKKIIGALQDITSEKIIENSLIELGENLNLGQKVAGIGSWKYNAVKNEIFWSDEIYRIYGLKPEEFGGSVIELMDFTYPADRDVLAELTRKRLAREKFDLQYRIQLRNGTTKYVRLVGEPIKNKDGLNTDLVGTIQDISDIKKLENEISFIKKNLEQAQRLAKIGSWEMNMATDENYMSAEALRIFGITAAEFKGTFNDFLSRVHPEDRSIITDSTFGNLSEEPFELAFRVIQKDGSIRDVFQIVEFRLDSAGQIAHVYGTIQDVSEKKAYERAIASKQLEIEKISQRSRILVQESGVVFAIISEEGILSYISDTARKVISYHPGRMKGRLIYDFYEPDQAEALKAMIYAVITEPEQVQTGIISFSGQTDKAIYLEVHVRNFLAHPTIAGLVLDFRDVTNRIVMQKKIEKLASYDEITTLPKANQLRKELAEKCRQANLKNASLILLMLDFEGFKEINDSLGHRVGQQLIVQLVMRLRGLLGKDTLISRYSEDQFAIVIEGLINLDAYQARVTEIIDFFYRSFKIDVYEFNINVNVGVSVYPLEVKAQELSVDEQLSAEDDINQSADGLDEIEQLIRYANIALIWSKKEGHNRYQFYSSELNIQNYKQLQLRHDLRMALKRNQFMVFYQPIVRIKTNDILAIEALIRWNHPDWGIVSPDEFIFLAEETGAIVEMGKWMLQKICDDHRYWIQKGYPPVYISLNFSSIQFYERNFVENIQDILAEYEVDPKYLIVELTESLLVEDSQKAIDDIKKLQAVGIKVALDDFGTGYSSLSYLNHFNVDIIKMDASFIRNVMLDSKTATIAQAIINLTKALHIKLVTEGIENCDHLAFLKEHNCYSGQGYLYSRPIPFLKIDELLQNRKCRPLLSRTMAKSQVERRKYFRQRFRNFLITELTILRINNKQMHVGNSRVLVKDIGPGGLCFISNIQFPLERDFTLRFAATLMGGEISAIGTPVRVEELKENLFEYGVKFMMDEQESEELTRRLYELQVKMKKNILFVDGSFTDKTAEDYFDELTGRPVKVDFIQYRKNNL